MVHTDDTYATTGYNESLEAVYLKYKRKGSSEEFRDANNRIVASMAKKPSHRVFVDVREMGVVAPEDQKWVATTIIPQLAKHAPGEYLYIAILVSEYIFTKLAVVTIEELSNGAGICHNRHFTSLTEAQQWLTQQTVREIR